jgi:predicted TPR repeat methyltransferase
MTSYRCFVQEQEGPIVNSDLDKIYTVTGDAEIRSAYDEWADNYDKDVSEEGYVTPARIAQALARLSSDQAAPIMDYGCGTGLAGLALRDAGFTAIDGADLSAGMLDIARDRNIYRDLQLVQPNQPPSPRLGDYAAIVAAGVISRGAAPPSIYSEMLEVMDPGALLAFSLNDLSLGDPEYTRLVPESVEAGRAKVLFDEYGPHLEKYGQNAGSRVFVVEAL